MIRINKINLIKFFMLFISLFIICTLFLKRNSNNSETIPININEKDGINIPEIKVDHNLHDHNHNVRDLDEEDRKNQRLKELEKFKQEVEKEKNFQKQAFDEKETFDYSHKKDLENKNEQQNDKFILNISAERINKLFDLIYKKEPSLKPIFNSNGIFLFEDLINKKMDSLPKSFQNFEKEISEYFVIEKDRVTVSQKFIDHLNQKSNYYSFEHPRTNVAKAKVTDNKPTIVTAANSAYYDALQATVYLIHQYLPDLRLVVYDLGLTDDQRKITEDNCNCEVRRFDKDGNYAKFAPHVSDLKTYAWKPLLIQECLRDYGTVIYIDSSIRFQSSELMPIIESLRDVSMMTQFIELDLNCYTNPKMFDWFGEKSESYKLFYTVEANILLFHQNFLTSLLMKSWVTCALDRNCIAPPGSSIGGCCGCHRYDQDAITIVNSFFYGHPIENRKYLPAYSFTKEESYFFTVRRYEGRSYFTSKNNGAKN